MEIPPFGLERWLARYETEAEVMLGESGIRPLAPDRFDLDVADLGYVIPTDGATAFRAHLGRRYDRTPEGVVLACGTQEANLLVHLAMLEPGDHAVVVTPTYQSLRSLPAALGAVSTVRVEPPTWSLDVDAVAAACRPSTRLIVLANPANPTGRYYGPDTIEALHEVAVEHDAYLHVDEVYRLLVDEPHPPAASIGERAISTAGVSKAYGLAGARVGWLAGSSEVADAARRWKDYTTIAPPRLGHRIAHQAVTVFEDELLAENRALAARNRALVDDFVVDLGLDWLEPATVVGFPTVPEGFADARAFCEAAFETEGVLLAPGDLFGTPDRFRIGFGAHTATLRSGLDRLRRLVEG
ncbi:MAG: aminotransferase class I/II-fold pyridoxal phosphate-dependent enzyme [Halobacteriales archaeon]